MPKNETDDLILSITKERATPSEQTQTKLQQTLEFKQTQQKRTFSFSPHPGDPNWRIALNSLKLNISLIFATEDVNKFELYRSTKGFREPPILSDIYYEDLSRENENTFRI